MEKRGHTAFGANRRDFLRVAAVSTFHFAFPSDVSAKIAKSLEPIPDYGNLLAKTEEFQEEFLMSLPEREKDALLARIRRLRPETYATLSSENEWRHLLRTGYVALRLMETRMRRSAESRSSASASDILLASESPLRPPMPWNGTYRASFFRNMPQRIEPFDLFATENRAVSINGNYGVFDGWRCREHTWDGRPLPTFLVLEHGDYLEIALADAIVRIPSDFIGSGIRMPSASIDAVTGTPLCSQVARKLGESLWLPFARGDSALASLRLYGNSHRKYSDFSDVPDSKSVADVFMRSSAHPSYWHRAFAMRSGTEWLVFDPFSHDQPISAARYRRRKDVFAIVAFG